MKQQIVIATRRRVEVGAKKVIIRQFPFNAQAHVSVGDTVSPDTVIATFENTGGFHLLRLSKQFGKGNTLQKYLHKKVGDRIYTGEIICEKPAFLPLKKHTLHSPVDGTIESLDEAGNMTIRLKTAHVSQASVFWGKVVAVDHFTTSGTTAPTTQSHEPPSIAIETQYLTIYGVMGSGRKREGRIAIVCSASDFMLPQNIDQSVHSAIVVCGALLDPGFLAKALRVGVQGIISGGIHLRDASAMGVKLPTTRTIGTDIGASMMITEGFGPLAINESFYTLLQQFANRFAVIDGNAGILVIPTHPDEKIHVPITEGSQFPSSVPAKIGQSVRIVAGESIGKVGIISAFGEPIELASGFVSPTVTVQLAGTVAETVLVPSPNIEALL